MSDYKGFQSVKLTRPKKSTFDLTHDKRLSTRMGRLTPCLMMECIPSDTFRGSSEMLVRMAPLLAPIYDQIQVFVHFFFVPNRLLWEDWDMFITGGRLGPGGGDPSEAPIPPYTTIGEVITHDATFFQKSSLADYLGVPVLPQAPSIAANYNGIPIDLMPFYAYQLVWYEYYRDRNFVSDNVLLDVLPSISGELDPVAVSDIMMVLRDRNYKHDYFTSALPFTQRGSDVLIPVDASVTYLDQALFVNNSTGAAPAAPIGLTANVDNTSDFNSAGVGGPHGIHNIESVSNTTTTINDFRTAYALQVWMERNAIAGSRYNESTEAHFDVKPQDMRLQRPEYLGGGRIPVKISEVLSTAWSNDGVADVPLANMGGHGVTYGNTNQFSYFCREHGFIIGILSIMNPPSYHQGMPRMFNRRRSFLDYPWPTFAKLGEQTVDKAELFATHLNLTEDVNGELPLFGYQSRYADWKFLPNTNHGLFHDDLLFWTLTREFASSPELGEAFNLFDDETQNRIFAVNQEEDNFWIYVHNKITVKRPLPYFGTPNTMGFV